MRIVLRASAKKNPQIKLYIEAVKRGKTNQHVVPADSGWKIKGERKSKAIKIFKTQKEAVDYAKTIAKNQGSDLFIHGKDGRIRERSSYRKGG